MYMDDIKLFVQNEKELETLIQTVRIYRKDIGMEFGIEKSAMLVVIHEALHPWDNIDRQYASRREGERGLASIENNVDASIQRLKDDIQNAEED